MRYWMHAEPATALSSEPVWTIVSDKAILASYYDHWVDRMKNAGKDALISTENCIQDWVTVHWAVEATPEALLRIINE